MRRIAASGSMPSPRDERSWRERAEAAARQETALEERRPRWPARSRPHAQARRDRAAARALAEIHRALHREAQPRPATSWRRRETHLAEAEKAAKAAEAALANAREERVRCRGAARPGGASAARKSRNRIAERLGTTPDRVAEVGEIDANEELPDLEQAETRLERLMRERDNMGPVNLVAEAEANELEQRVQASRPSARIWCRRSRGCARASPPSTARAASGCWPPSPR